MDCVQGVFTNPAGDGMEGLTACMLDADPAVSKEASEFLRCVILSENPQTACTAQISACAAK
jgi:hypothetical protein